MIWKIEFESTAKKELHTLSQVDAKRILKYLSERIMLHYNPRTLGQALKGSRFEDLSQI